MSHRTQTIEDELLALRDEHGLINVNTAHDWAQVNNNSRLHAELVWDDAVAGKRYRLWQLRSLIAVTLVDKSGDRRFVSLSIDRVTGGYRSIDDIVQRVDLRETMLADSLAELERLRRKYEHLTELSGVWAAASTAATKQKARRKPSSKAA